MKTRYWILAVLAMAMLVSGCAAKSYDMATEEMAWEADKGYVEELQSAPEANYDMDDAVRETEEGGSGAGLAEAMPRMIIYNASLDLIVTDTDAAEQEITTLTESLGGYIANSSSYNYGEGLRTINITLRIPSDKFQEAMAAMRDMAVEVRSDSISSSDVTQEYVDLDSRLGALEVKADKLEELMDEADDTEDVLAVYNELSATEQEIEQVKGRMKYLENLSAMGTIEVHLEPDELAQPVELPGWRPQGTVKRAFEALLRVIQNLVDALIWIIITILPVVVFIGLVAFGFIKLLSLIFGKRRRARRKVEGEAVEADSEQG